MHAARKFLEDQLNEARPMEARIAVIESHVGHVKDVLNDIMFEMRGVKDKLKDANNSIAALQREVASINATLPHLATKADL